MNAGPKGIFHAKPRWRRMSHRGTMKRIPGGLVCLALFLPMVACVTAPAKDSPRTEAQAYRSDEYIVYQVQPGDSASALARHFLGDAKLDWMIEDENPGAFFPGNWVAIPLKIPNRGGLEAEGYQKVPILCYHSFAEECKTSLCMPVALFRQQMQYLKDNGYRVISLSQLRDFLEYRQAIPRKSVVLTVDDGYESAYTVVYPTLTQLGFTATLFIYTDFVGAGGKAVTWEQLKEMRDAGFEVGSHTLSHCDLTTAREGESQEEYAARIRLELARSKEIIDQKLSQNTMFLAFPYGKCNPFVLDLSRQAGYDMALSVKRGGNAFFADPLRLRRDQIIAGTLTDFSSRLNTFQPLVLRPEP